MGFLFRKNLKSNDGAHENDEPELALPGEEEENEESQLLPLPIHRPDFPTDWQDNEFKSFEKALSDGDLTLNAPNKCKVININNNDKISKNNYEEFFIYK